MTPSDQGQGKGENKKDWAKFLSDEKVVQEFRTLHWEGSFWTYLDAVKSNPTICRNAFQRAYDMILSWGADSYVDYKKSVTHYKFFEDPIENGKDAVFGLDVPLMKLVNFVKSAAMGYGTEKRVLLLHGPVGSAKSTIARLLKKGIEQYSRTEAGALYTFKWVDPEGKFKDLLGSQKEVDCPMHEDPLKLVPIELRAKLLEEINKGRKDKEGYRVAIVGDLNPHCRFIWNSMMKAYGGDWTKVMDHVRVKRMILSEKDRIGIGTFQPKDEKNQDSTELTGDINYRKIAE
ncbi:MAG: hypothetical protein IT285_01415, partial [Bdellovibrionales bacterium]|nr:hypothetical protein [Bdellovibrionales bacterium]